MSLTIGLTYDLKRDYLALGYKEEEVAEFDADITIDTIERTIAELGFKTDRIGHVRALCTRLAAGARWDLVFNIAEGVSGRSREAQIPCLLEAYDIPYTLSDPLVCAVTLDKAVAKRILKAEGLNTAGFHVVHTESDVAKVNLPFPLFAKPIAEGTGKGIDRASRITNAAELRAVCQTLLLKFNQPVLIEEYLPGREFTVAILGTGPQARVMGTMEVCFRDTSTPTIYTYEVKENYTSHVDYHCPPRTPETEAVERLALDSYRALELRDAGRVDIRLDRDNRPSFMEVNPLPGLNPLHSDLPIIGKLIGMSYRDIIRSIIESARTRIAKPA
ncbi:MAG: D-alanine--D-alanine ligase [bacterium]